MFRMRSRESPIDSSEYSVHFFNLGPFYVVNRCVYRCQCRPVGECELKGTVVSTDKRAAHASIMLPAFFFFFKVVLMSLLNAQEGHGINNPLGAPPPHCNKVSRQNETPSPSPHQVKTRQFPFFRILGWWLLHCWRSDHPLLSCFC